MTENQNKEHEQTEKAIPSEAQNNSELTTSLTPVLTSAEIKEETIAADRIPKANKLTICL